MYRAIIFALACARPNPPPPVHPEPAPAPSFSEAPEPEPERRNVDVDPGPMESLSKEPPPPIKDADPFDGRFTLAEAFAGDAALQARASGRLIAVIRTPMGAIDCELFENKAPIAVANFVGLARGTRPFRHETGGWTNARFYDGVSFHRVVAGFMIQAGDRQGTGKGRIGYTIPDELDDKVKFDAPGVLATANRGPNTADSQFFITVAAAPHLAKSHTVFGKCDPKVPIQISKVKVDASNTHRPLTAVIIQRIDFERR